MPLRLPPCLRHLRSLRPATRRRIGSHQTAAAVFDRRTKRQHRDYAARIAGAPDAPVLQLHGLKDEVAAQLLDRLEDITRDFPAALDLGCGLGHLSSALRSAPGAGGISQLVAVDSSEGMVRFCAAAQKRLGGVETTHAVMDEEFLGLGDASFDLVLSSMAMHWVNDLPGMLAQTRRCLRPDGAFLGAMLGGSTLDELRVSLLLAEQEREGGVAPHVSPMAQLSDAAGLVSGAGFRLPVVDSDTYVLHYQNMHELLRELGQAGDNNAVITRRTRVPKATFDRAAEIYAERFGNGDGTVRASFQVIYLIGWKEHASQPQPLARGSAKASMKDVLESSTGPPQS